MSRTFSTNCGSLESLKVSLRCGANEKAFQMRCTVEMDTPDVLAIERVLQCVASAGIVSSVFVTTSAIFSSPILRGAPQRGSSSRPSKRFLTNRFRHSPAVSRERPSGRDRAIVHALGGQQHDLGSHRIDPSNLSATRAHFQLAALAVPEDDLHRWTTRHLHLRIKKTGRGNHDPMVMTRNF